MTAAPLLCLRAVSLSYGAHAVLHDVDLEVRAGSVHVLVGPNGAGKTSLLRAIAGTLAVAAGSIELEGRALSSMPRSEIARKIAVVPQEVAIVSGFSVREVVMMGRAPHQGRWMRVSPRDEAIVDDKLTRCGVSKLSDRPFDELSGGERKRVMIAQALAQEPTLLLLDEPTAFLDLRHALDVFELIDAEVAGGLAVVASVHDLGLAARYADEVLVLVDGCVRARGAVEAVMTEEVLGDAFEIPLHRLVDASGAVAIVPVVSRRKI